MLTQTSVGTTRRYSLVLGLCLVTILVVACGRGTRKNPNSPAVNPTPMPISTARPTVPGMLKIGVDREGLYELTSAEIKKLMPGWDNIDPDHLRLTLRGQDQPIWVSTQGEDFQIRFYGYPSNSRYTDKNIYLLAETDGNTLRMGEKQLSGEVSLPTASFLTTIRFEENKLYEPQALEGDHLYWLSLAGGKKQEFEVNLPKLVNGGGHLRVMVWGSTQSPQEYDHHLVISLNDQILVDEKWDGAGTRTLEADIPDGLLKDGKNVVVMEAPGDTGAAAEINYVDWIEINYPRLAEADDDFLNFQAPANANNYPLQLSQFSGSISIVDVTVPTETVRIAGATGEKSLIFPAEAGRHYLAVGPKGFSRPADLAPAVILPDLRAPDLGADYVMIAPSDLLPSLSPLVDWRTSQGLKVISVPLEAVYDQFNGGMPEAEAIHTFMVYAAQSWNPSPRFLLLVGDATYDPRGYISSPEANRLPVLFLQTSFGGETASDALFGDVDGDLLPDLAVGRIPAQNADQVQVLVQKILSYEQDTTPDGWHDKILAIADGQDATFKQDAQAFLDQVSAPYTYTLYAPEAGVKDAPDKVKAYFDEGYAIIAYFGHGSINMWGKDRILMAEDVSSLSNSDRLPVVINMTCLTGLFIHPKVTSLMETLLWYEGGGAVAMLAPTSLTLPSSQSYLSQALIETLMQNPKATLGENFLQAERMVPVSDQGAREVLLTFLLFGDPALKFGNK